MKIPSSRTLMRFLNDIPLYLRPHHQNLHSTYFEFLNMECIARIFKLPFFPNNEDSSATKYKVCWNGSSIPISRALGGGPDGILKSYGFNCIIEITQKEQANQWTQEGAQLVRHTQGIIDSEGWDQLNTYTLFIVPSIHNDTYFNLHGQRNDDKYIILLEVNDLKQLLQTSNLTYSMKYLDFIELFGELLHFLEVYSDVNDYQGAVNHYINRWMAQVLNDEKDVYIGLKSYKAMKSIGRINIAQSEIYSQIKNDPYLLQYLKIIDKRLTPNLITNCLVNQCLAKCIRYLPDKLLNPVPYEDYNQKINKIVEKAEKIWK